MEATHRLREYMALLSIIVAVSVLITPELVIYTIVLLAVPLLSRVIMEVNLYAVEKLKVYSDVSVERDDRISVTYTVENPLWMPVFHLEYSIRYSELLRLVEGVKSGLLVIPPKSTLKLRFVFKERLGEHIVGPLKIIARDPFGFYRSNEIELGRAVILRIPPKPEEVIVRKLYSYARSTGLVKSRTPGDGVEFYDVRDYSPGDEARRIVWRIYESRRRLAVWESEREVHQPVIFILDASREMWSGPFGQSMVEHSARIIASVVYYLVRRGYSISTVVFNESMVDSSGRPIHGHRGYLEAIRILSKAKFTGVDAPRSSMLVGALSYTYKNILPRDRSVVFLFTHITRSMLRVLIEWNSLLRSRGHVLYIINPLITSYESRGDLPDWAARIYEVKLMKTLREDVDALTEARLNGLLVIAVTPSMIPQRVIDAVERYSM